MSGALSDRCPLCNSRAYVGLLQVKCINPGCRCFSEQDCREWLKLGFDYTDEQADNWIAEARTEGPVLG